MYPAPSIILFTVLSGLGFGYLAFLGAGFVQPSGWAAFGLWGLGYGLAVGGLLASTTHLGRPERAWRAFTQWRTSWLSREAWASVAALVVLAPVALSDWLGLGWSRGPGLVGAVLSVLTVLATSMIYAQIRAVPRWHSVTVAPVFVGLALSGGAILAEQAVAALVMLAVSAVAMVVHWRRGYTAFARAGSTLGTATGLGTIGRTEVFELPHTGNNYLMREMIFVVGRKHVRRLRAIALVAGIVVPALGVVLAPGPIGMVGAVTSHLLGVFAQRWLFFAQAEHVVGLYYGRHGG